MNAESFWNAEKFLVISDGSKVAVSLTIDELESRDKRVEVVNPSPDDGISLPSGSFDAAVISVPGRTGEAVDACLRAGVPRIWIHWRTETPGAIRLCEGSGVEYVAGRCPMMYLGSKWSIHGLHAHIARLLGKY